MNIRLATSVKPRMTHVGASLLDGDALARRHDPVEAENARLAAEVERLRQENEDLREAAEIWIRLYENQLSRANRAAELLAHCANALGSAPQGDGSDPIVVPAIDGREPSE